MGLPLRAAMGSSFGRTRYTSVLVSCMRVGPSCLSRPLRRRLYNSNGIDIAALTEYRQKEGTIHGFKGAEAADTEQLLITDCDMLVPAATEAVITSLNADKVKAKILVEGANGPTTAVADEILADNHVFVMPDILANAGGVTAS